MNEESHCTAIKGKTSKNEWENDDSEFSASFQPWELVAAFRNAIVNAVLFWFYEAKKMLS